MAKDTQKYLHSSEHPYPHCGQLIRQYLKANKIQNVFVARKLGVTLITFAHYFRSPSLQLGIIWKIGIAVGYNFLAEIAAKSGIPYPTIEEQALQQLLQEKDLLLQQKDSIIQKLEIQLEVYKQLKG